MVVQLLRESWLPSVTVHSTVTLQAGASDADPSSLQMASAVSEALRLVPTPG